MKQKNHLHFIGIAGALTAGAAKLAKEKGFRISGSDRAFYPPFGDEARALDARLFADYKAAAKDIDADCYVVGNAISRGNPLMESVLSSRRPYISAAQWLGENILAGKKTIAIAGTHGKTTTTILIAHILERAGLSPGFLAGGIAPTFNASARAGKSDWFVIEADEYDSAFFDKRPKFMHYRPHIALLHNLEFDHSDIYKNVGEIARQFHFLLRTIPANGRIVAQKNSRHLQSALNMGAYSPVSFFGGANAKWRYARKKERMHIFCDAKEMCNFVPPLIGSANRDNILAAIAVAHYAGADARRAGEYLSDFRPPLRRMQKLADANGVLVFDDFAHHPTAYRKTLQALAEEYPQKRIVAVFEPRSNAMKAGVFRRRLPNAFAAADVVVAVGEQEWLADSLPPSKKAIALPDAAAAVDFLRAEIRPNDCVILMSNGDFANLPQTVATMAKS